MSCRGHHRNSRFHIIRRFYDKKYADGLNKIYKDIFKVELQADCKSYISLLKECNVQSESIELLENFIYFRFNFRNRFVKRKIVIVYLFFLIILQILGT